MSELNLHPELNPATRFIAFDDRRELEARLCQRIVERLAQGIAEKGAAALVVSGGRTPGALFQALSEQPLEWSKVAVTLADERWVDGQHDDSNERSVRTHLLKNRAADARFLPLFNGADSPEAGQASVEEQLSALPEKIDVVILGMGEDGHTASFFPAAAELDHALNPEPYAACAAINPPVAPFPRMTLTLPRLLASAEIYVHLCGDYKLPVLQNALSEGDVKAMPIRSVLRQGDTPVSVYWAP